MNIHDNVSHTNVEISLLWAYRHPDLLKKTVDDLFLSWGNKATYWCVLYTPSSVHLVAERNTDNTRTCMTDVMNQKSMAIDDLKYYVMDFVERERNSQRYGSEFIWAGNDKARKEALERMGEMA